MDMKSERFVRVAELLDQFIDAVLEIDPERVAHISIGQHVSGTGHIDLKLEWRVVDQLPNTDG